MWTLKEKSVVDVKDFVKWALAGGQQSSNALGFCNLPTRIAGLASKAADEVR
jgi:hypothetical protein